MLLPGPSLGLPLVGDLPPAAGIPDVPHGFVDIAGDVSDAAPGYFGGGVRGDVTTSDHAMVGGSANGGVMSAHDWYGNGDLHGAWGVDLGPLGAISIGGGVGGSVSDTAGAGTLGLGASGSIDARIGSWGGSLSGSISDWFSF